jgi:hypothetical protein
MFAFASAAKALAAPSRSFEVEASAKAVSNAP